MGEKKISGKIVAVIGSGMTGLETTEILNESGNHVVVVEMAEEIAPGTWFQLKDDEPDSEIRPGVYAGQAPDEDYGGQRDPRGRQNQYADHGDG